MKNLFFIFLSFFITTQLYASNDSTHTDTLKFILEGTITDVDDNLPIENATIRLIGTDSSNIITKTDSMGFYTIKLKPTTSYTIEVQANKHLNSRGEETTINQTTSLKFIHDFKLIPLCSPRFPTNIHFKTNSVEPLNSDYQPDGALLYFYNILLDNPQIAVEIAGYRSPHEDQHISRLRAQNLINQLIKLGIEKDRLYFRDGGIRFELAITEEIINLDKEEVKKRSRVVTILVLRDDYQS